MVTEDEFEQANEVPTDEAGHPIHPERGHRICGAAKSDRTTPTEHGRERDDYDYCLLPAGWGTDVDTGPCRNHPFSGSQIGESNPNHKHGGYSQYLDEDQYTEDELERLEQRADDLTDPEKREDVFKSFIADLWIRWDRTKDPRFAREIRQTLAEFGFTPEEAKQFQIEHSGSVDVEHDVPEYIVEAIIGASESNLEAGDEA